MNQYLKQAVELSKKSFENGKFPAGAVLVTKSGGVYTSDPSLAYYHGECMVIDKAIEAEGFPLIDSVIYSSMESCLMCSTKMYWAGITEVHFVIPKSSTNTLYAYEDSFPMQEKISKFNTPLISTQHSDYIDEALELYQTWVKKIEEPLK